MNTDADAAPEASENITGAATGDGGPVTISIARKVLPGKEAEYEAWVKGITAAAVNFPGHPGVSVIRPSPPSREYVTIVRFDSYEQMAEWKDSSIRKDWLARLDGIVEGEGEVRKGTGLEFWFSLPELPVASPSPHKMVLVISVVVYAIVMAIGLFLVPFMRDWAPWLRTLVVVVLQVSLMTYVVMPLVSRWLKDWLFK